MALLRNIGNPVTIAAGATHYWHYWFGKGSDVGVALVTPNLLDPSINIELIASDHGVLSVAGQGEDPSLIRYTVRIRNSGAFPMTYNLNIGNLL